jgi:hypothetical protein
MDLMLYSLLPLDNNALKTTKMASDELLTRNKPTTVQSPTSEPQKRKRAVRTYGRRSIHPKSQRQSNAKGEGEKRRGEESRPSTPEQQENIPPTHLSTPVTQEKGRKPNRGSILAYFKPFPARPNDAPSCESSPKTKDVLSTPPDSPATSLRPRKRRRLTTKPETLESVPLPNSSNDAGDAPAQAPSDEIDEKLPKESDRLTEDDCITVQTGTYAAQAATPALRGVSVNTLDTDDQATATGPRRNKKPAKDMMQTTLNLSIHKDSSFKICAVCDLLYNPLNEKDRKEHNRRHAAALRSKRKEG